MQRGRRQIFDGRKLEGNERRIDGTYSDIGPGEPWRSRTHKRDFNFRHSRLKRQATGNVLRREPERAEWTYKYLVFVVLVCGLVFSGDHEVIDL